MIWPLKKYMIFINKQKTDMKGTITLIIRYICCALLLCIVSVDAAVPSISNVTVEVKAHDDGKQYVVVNYEIKDVPTDGVVVKFEATCSKDDPKFTPFKAVPDNSELTGDYGLVTGDGKKSITWEDETYLVRINKQDKFHCKVKLSMAGSDNTISGASLVINSYSPSGWYYFNTGLLRMTIEKKLGTEPEFSCPQLGANWANEAMQQGATFYKVTAIPEFPLYLGRNSNDKFKGSVTNIGCSSFLAIRDYGKPTQKLWANFTRRFVSTQDVNGTNVTQDFEFQFRYSSTAQSGENLSVINAGKQGQQIALDLNSGGDIKFELEAGKIGEVESSSFDIEVPRREWKYVYKGKHVFTIKVDDKKSKFEGGNVPGTISLTDGNVVSIGSALKFIGPRMIIDTTPDNCKIHFFGDIQTGSITIVNSLALGTGATLLLNDSLVFSVWPSPVDALSALSGYNIGIERMRLTGDPNGPDGILFDLRILIKDLSAGCEPLLWSAGTAGLLLRDIGISSSGQWSLPASLQMNNLGLTGLPDWCIKNLSLSYDKSADKFAFDCLTKAPWFSDAGLAYSSIKGKLESFKLTLKSAVGICPIPIPEPPPLHAAVFRGGELEISNWYTGPRTLKGTLFAANRDDWAFVGAFRPIKLALGGATDWSIFEIDGGVSGNELGDFATDGKIRFLGKADVWAAQFRGKNMLSIGIGKFGVGFNAGADIVQLGGEKWFYTGDAIGSISILPEFIISNSLRGDIFIPDLFKNHPVFQMINAKLGLPLRLTSVQLFQRNTQLSFDLDFGWLGAWSMWVDISKNPFTEPTKFIGTQSGSVQKLSSISPRQGSIDIQAVDTTYVPFTIQSAKYAYAQIFADPQLATFLLGPGNKVYSSTTLDSSIIFSAAKSSADMGLWVLKNPTDGEWKLGVIGRKNGDSISIWQINKPRKEFSFIATNVGRNVYCNWETGGSSDTSFVDFYLDKDTLNNDGQFIGTVLEKNGSFSYALADSLNECGYYIYAQRWSGERASMFLYAPNYMVNTKIALSAPQNRSGSFNLQNVVTLRWTPSPDKNVRFYIIHVIDENGQDSLVASVEPGLTSYSFQIENPAAKHFLIQAFGPNNTRGCSAAFSGVVLAVDDERGDMQGVADIQVSPNPASQRLCLSYRTDQTDGQADIRIVNSLGQLVMEHRNIHVDQGVHSLVLDAMQLPSDVYFVYIATSGRALSTKFSVLR